MTKPKLNIREMIRSGEIDTARAGQLVTLSYYTRSGLLSDSDERALRETAKDARLYNAYMGGGRELHEAEIFLIGLSGEAKLGIQKLAWIGAELRHTIDTLYTPPRVIALTEDGYKRIGKEKREKRLKRTYTLVTLYRALAENLIKYPEGKDEERILADLKQYPEDATEGNVYGIDLIDPNGRGEVIEYWRGWIAYYNGLSQEYDEELAKLDTIDKLAEEIPEAHAIIMTKLEALYKAKKLSIDPQSIPLDKWHKTPLDGSELAQIAEEIPLVRDLLNSTEHSLLDEYKDEGETEEQASNRSIYEKYDQAYAILKNPEGYRVKDGILQTDSVNRPRSIWGYRGEDKYDSMGAKAPLDIIKNNRETIRSNLHILYAFSQWRQKTGELLGIDKTDEFKAMTGQLDAIELYNTYEVYRSLLVDNITSEIYILPEYRKYTDMIVEAYKPLGDESDEANYKGLLHKRDAMREVIETVESIYKRDKSVAKALKTLDDMTIYSIKDSFYAMRDALSPLIERKGASNDE